MPGVRGTRTETNLLTAFAGESQARKPCTCAASQAKKDDLVQIAKIFEETADQEKEHARRFFKLLEIGEVEIQAAFPAGVIGSAAENLQGAAAGENHEWTQMYPEFAAIAREEGLDAVAIAFESIAVAEKQHEKRYLGVLVNVQNGTVYQKDEPVVWRCQNCGYTHEGAEAPAACPAGAHPQAYFEVLAENW